LADQTGRILVNTGDGKGKTTAALGVALRAVGQGMRVLMVQFLKGNWSTGEIKAIQRLEPEMTAVRMGKGFTWEHDNLDEDRAAALAAWEASRQALASGEYDVVILDEINYAIHYGFLGAAEVIAALKARPAQIHVILTGNHAHRDIIALADTVTDMQMVKHAFRDGTRAARGIEY
jgi:cob(I)alamin adenosyltransferase